MAIINQATKELQVKIVYYGPAKSGKTTNLESIYGNIQTSNPESKSKIVSLATSSDRTLFFDFFPLETVTIKGVNDCKCKKLKVYGSPGSVVCGKR